MDSVDILMSSYNGEKFIEEQLLSLLNQSHKNIKIIIRDDGSVDSTRKIIFDYMGRFPGKIEYFNENVNLGSSKSFLRLLNFSSADYFMFCDQDDVWCSDKVEKCLMKMKEMEISCEKGRPILIFTDLKVVDAHLNILSESLWRTQKLDPNISLNWKKLLAQNVVTGCTMMLNKHIKEYIKQEVNFKIHHDQLIAVLASKYGAVSWVSFPTMLYRQHHSNVLGALGVNGSYLMRKILGLKNNIRFFIQASEYFDKDVSAWELFYLKLMINIRRFQNVTW
ncbi:glycosyltransferase family 2 protein [Comamonas aquatica]|uniref:glycosyltransferase family 2 protein n=1 Tax=Comamonas aquatica TaxID=225991 RepID=UPI0024497BE2|nr:glycosyltransferase family 2 protein [Comamonas aquatica]MDH0493840.1 glycosyltransferase family 2 protein [Comamonas aquatica]